MTKDRAYHQAVRDLIETGDFKTLSPSKQWSALWPLLQEHGIYMKRLPGGNYMVVLPNENYVNGKVYPSPIAALTALIKASRFKMQGRRTGEY